MSDFLHLDGRPIFLTSLGGVECSECGAPFMPSRPNNTRCPDCKANRRPGGHVRHPVVHPGSKPRGKR